MATNPLVDQGVVNRLRASVVWASFPTLNVTPAYLGEDAINMALEGDASTQIPTMTGAVQSPEPYMAVAITINLLRTQPLADLYKKQMEKTALLGDCTVRPDATPLSPYPFYNCSIQGVRELNFGGRSAGWIVTCRGYYLVNSDLWNL